MNNLPKITVLLPVYNREEYLGQAIQSVLDQTFTQFELLLINDGSTDGSVKVIESFKDKRIRLIHNEQNMGLVKTLNKGLKIAKGNYIARMDSDDVCLPSRLADQLKFMEQNPHISISGGFYRQINGKTGPVRKFPLKPEQIKAHLFFCTALAHPTIIFKKSDIEKFNLYYDDSYKHAEDFELWVRASRFVKFANIKKVLIHYRVHESQISVSYNNIQQNNLNQCRKNQLKELDLTYSIDEFEIHKQLSNQHYANTKEFLIKVEKWLLKIYNRNNEVKLFNQNVFASLLGDYWLGACYAVLKNDKAAKNLFSKSKLSKKPFLSIAQAVKIRIKSL